MNSHSKRVSVGIIMTMMWIAVFSATPVTALSATLTVGYNVETAFKSPADNAADVDKTLLANCQDANNKSRRLAIIILSILIVSTLIITWVSVLHTRRYRRLAENEQRVRQQREKLLSIVAHEIRNPLVTLLTSLKMLRDCIDDEDKETKKIVNNIIDNITNQFQMTSNLLSWGKLQTGDIKPDCINFDAVSAMSEAEKLVEEPMTVKNIRLTHLFPGRHIFVYADRQMFMTILRNLYHNAIKFSNNDSSITVKVEKEGDFFAFFVIDEGVGIKPEVAESIFRSSVSSAAGTSGEEGAGYGLFICKSLANLCGGSVTLAPDHRIGDTGTAVKLTLPASINQTI